jgi:hypothetical protein
MNLCTQWGQWDLNPRPPAPQAYTHLLDGILDQARRWPRLIVLQIQD